MTATNLNDLLARVGVASSPPPRSDAIDAIRTIEAALVEALHGHSLRGLPNLGTGRSPSVGANVRGGTIDARISFPRDGQAEGKATLVLRPDGHLAIAWTVRQPWNGPSSAPALFEFCHRGADDADLLVEDLGAILRLLPQILTDHLSEAEKTQAGWLEVKALAHRVLDLVPRR